MDLHDQQYWTQDGGPFTFDEYVEQSRPRPGESEQDAWDRVHRVAQDAVDHYVVSTVCLMSDIGFFKPERFETMVFGPNYRAVDDYTQRYATRTAALAGHDQVVMEVRRWLGHVR